MVDGLQSMKGSIADRKEITMGATATGVWVAVSLLCSSKSAYDCNIVTRLFDNQQTCVTAISTIEKDYVRQGLFGKRLVAERMVVKKNNMCLPLSEMPVMPDNGLYVGVR